QGIRLSNCPYADGYPNFPEKSRIWESMNTTSGLTQPAARGLTRGVLLQPNKVFIVGRWNEPAVSQAVAPFDDGWHGSHVQPAGDHRVTLNRNNCATFGSSFTSSR